MPVRAKFRKYQVIYVLAIGALAFIATLKGDTYVEDTWWGIGRWLIGIAAVLTLPAGIVVAPPFLYLCEALGLTDESGFVDAIIVAVALMLSAAANGALWTYAIRKMRSWRRRRAGISE